MTPRLGDHTFTPQAERALKLANAIRIERAQLKRELRAVTVEEARERLASIMDGEPPAFLQSMMLGAFLELAPRMGRHKSIQITTRIGRTAGAGWVRPVADLTLRQREVLAHELRR